MAPGDTTVGSTPKKQINLVDVREHRVREYLNLKDWDTRLGRFSPDGRWIAFLAACDQGTRPYVIPYRAGAVPQPEHWVRATDEEVENEGLDWSPDGRLLHFIMTENGKKSLWARRFNSASGSFHDLPFVVYHFNDVRHSPFSRDFGFSVGVDKIVCSLNTVTSQVWLLEP